MQCIMQGTSSLPFGDAPYSKSSSTAFIPLEPKTQAIISGV